MSVGICNQKFDVISKQEVVTLIDSFGQKHVVQYPMTDGKNYGPALEQEIAAMAARETAFIAALKERGVSDPQIAAMQKKPGDCGCSKS